MSKLYQIIKTAMLGVVLTGAGVLFGITLSVSAQSILSEIQGGTGEGSYNKGDLLFATSSDNLTRLPVGSDGQVLKVNSNSRLVWGADTGGSGGGDGLSTTTPFTAGEPVIVHDDSTVKSSSTLGTNVLDSSVMVEGENNSLLNNDSGYITDANDSVDGSELDNLFSQNGFLERIGSNSYQATSTIDVSDDTNLSGGTNVTLNGDAIDVDDAFLVNNADDTTTGKLTVQGGVLSRASSTINGDLTVTETTVIGDSATSTGGIFEVNGNSAFEGTVDLSEIAEPAGIANTARLYSFDQNGETRVAYIDGDGVVTDIAQDNTFNVRNTTGVTINKGKVVYISAQTGATPEVALAKSDSSTTMPAVAVLNEDIANNGYGKAIKVGVIEGIDTSAFSVNDELFVSATTAGDFTNTRPPHPHVNQAIGRVIVSGVGNGSIQVNMEALMGDELGTQQNTYSIGDGTAGTKTLDFDADTDGEITWDGSEFSLPSLNINGAFSLPTADGTNGQVMKTDGSGTVTWQDESGGGGSPGGSDTQLQYNNGGSFGGASAVTYDDTNGKLDVTAITNATDTFSVANSTGQNLIEADTTNGTFVVRQPGGTAGADEVQISYDGTQTVFNVPETSRFGSGFVFRESGNDTLKFKNDDRTWSDDKDTAFFLQSDTSINRMLFAGEGGNAMKRLGFSSDGTVFSQEKFNAVAVPEGLVDINLNSASKKGLTIQAASSQSANLTEWQDSAGNVLAKIDSGGGFLTNASSTIDANFNANNTVTFSNLTNCDTIDTDANGQLSCGTDDTAGTGVATTSPISAGNVAVFADEDTIKGNATSSISLGSDLSYSGTLGDFVNGADGTLSLANNSVSYGGVSVSLGGSDATPAFDLTDATNLDISSGTNLSGTTNEIELSNDTLSLPSATIVPGSFETDNGTAPTVDAEGEIAHDTTNDQLVFGSDADAIQPDWDKGMTVGTSTLNTGDFGTFGPSATATVRMTRMSDPVTLASIDCVTTTGSVSIEIGDGTNFSDNLTCDSSGQTDTTLSNNSFNAREGIEVNIGNGTSDFDNVTITIEGQYDRQ